ncbi:hypothetical protein L0244_34965, partial [bacterium]|nr:hypothetical protein [bacterium]
GVVAILLFREFGKRNRFENYYTIRRSHMVFKQSKMLFLILAGLACFQISTLAWAQGSGSTAGGSRPIYEFEVKANHTGEITEIDVSKGFFLVYVEKEKKRFRFEIDPETKFKADKKTGLDGKKAISLSDLQVGHTVKVTYREKDGRVFEVRLKRSEESKTKTAG